MIRLDKFLSETGTLSRSEGGKAIRNGRITVNDIVAKKPETKVDPENDIIALDGNEISYRKFTYIMMNKPQGIVSATDDPNEKTVIDLLPDNLKKLGLFPCGRLDKNTVGLVILTNNGPLAHKLLAPKSHAEKEYYFETKFPFSDDDIKSLENGVDIGGYTTAPCKVIRESEKSGRIILTEGKYHQIKFMLVAVHNQIRFLKRIRFASVILPDDLSEGEWRLLDEDEISRFS